MSYGISRFGPLLFGWFKNALSTIQLIDGSTTATYRSNPGALEDYLNLARIAPNRNIGSSLAAV